MKLSISGRPITAFEDMPELRLTYIISIMHCLARYLFQIGKNYSMKKSLLLLWTFSLLCLFSAAQNVPNRGFESWETDTIFEEPNDWNTGNSWFFFNDSDSLGVARSNDAQHGMHSLRLKNFVSGGDTTFGLAFSSGWVDGEPPNLDWQDGFPLTANPDSLKCWMKFDLPAGDTGMVGIGIKNGGVVLWDTLWQYAGQQTSWMEFAWDIPTLGQTADSAVIAFTSGNPDSAKDGAWLMVDDVRLVGTSDTVPNGSFENWEAIAFEEPNWWGATNSFAAVFDDTASVVKSMDAHSGSYSCEITTTYDETFDNKWSFISSSKQLPDSNGFTEGFEWNHGWADSLTFWYKYSTPGVDTGMAIVAFRRYDPVGDSVIWLSNNGALIPPTANWTQMSIPISGDTTETIDTAIVIFTSSKGFFGDGDSTMVVGSQLHVDDMWIHWLCDWTDTTMTLFASDSASDCDQYIIDPGITGYDFMWSNGDTTETITVDTSMMYSLTISDGNGCSVTDSVYVTITPCPGFEDPPALENVVVFPNPTEGVLQISAMRQDAGGVEVSLNSITGAVYSVEHHEMHAGKSLIEMNISELPNGIYFLSLKTEDQTIYRKVVKN